MGRKKRSNNYTNEERLHMVDIAYNVRYACRDINMSGAELARRADISPNAVYGYLRAEKMATEEDLRKMASVLGCAYEDLIAEYDASAGWHDE